MGGGEAPASWVVASCVVRRSQSCLLTREEQILERDTPLAQISLVPGKFAVTEEGRDQAQMQSVSQRRRTSPKYEHERTSSRWSFVLMMTASAGRRLYMVVGAGPVGLWSTYKLLTSQPSATVSSARDHTHTHSRLSCAHRPSATTHRSDASTSLTGHPL